MKNNLLLSVFIGSFIIAHSATTANGEDAATKDCSDDIFLPKQVFQYKGPGQRNVWLGITQLPDDLKGYEANLAQKLRDLLKMGFVEKNLHLTLKFLGSISPDTCAQETVGKALSNVLVFPMKLVPQGLKILTNRNGTPKLIALTFASPNIKLFRMSLENALDGFAGRDTRGLWVHSTLLHFPKNAPKLSAEMVASIENMDVTGGPFKVNGFELVQSGATLKVLKAFGEKGLDLKKGRELLAQVEDVTISQEPAFSQPVAADDAAPSPTAPPKDQALKDQALEAPAPYDGPKTYCQALAQYWQANEGIYAAALELNPNPNIESSKKLLGILSEAIVKAKRLIEEKGWQEGPQGEALCILGDDLLKGALKAFLQTINMGN